MRITGLLLALAVIACTSTERASERTPWTTARTTELQRRVAEDQALRNRLMTGMRSGVQPDSALMAELRVVDSANTHWLREAVAAHGWPERSVVGAEAAGAAFLLVQHASSDTAFRAAMLQEITDAFQRGEADGQSVALLTDRVAVTRGQPQVYGTQGDIRDGRMLLAPIADSAGLDKRRARMGLLPIGEYLRLLDSMYVGRPAP